jgi:dTDP-3,4-didehydro-2,6-dideoxy-alpha-D-glucose 3-reductase
MKILILGYSNLCQRKILPTLLKSFKDIDISICSKSKKKIKNIKWFKDYNSALLKSNADIVYISIHNSKHFYWAKKFLTHKYHVIIDKPATLNYKDAKKLIKLAKSKKKLLAEATVFNYHKQIKLISKKINKNIKIDTRFTIPLLPKKNFRRNLKLGGGCLNDMGPYAASICRLFFKDKINKKDFVIFKKKIKDNLVQNFQIKIIKSNFEFNGYFSHNDKYENNLKFYTTNNLYEFNRVFSPPANKNLIVKVTNKKKLIKQTIEIKKDNVFEKFFQDCFKSIRNRKYDIFYRNCLKDSLFREHLI